MQVENIMLWLNRLPVITSAIGFLLMIRIGKSRPEKKILRACEEWKGYLTAKSEQTDWYARKREWLCKMGAAFHFGSWVQPISWLALCLLCAFAGLIIGLYFNVWLSIPLAVLLYYIPGALALWMNSRDNEKMLPEIKLIYHALEIQTRAGVYMTDALTECYAGVQDERLKQALLDLAGDITMKSDIYDALEQFQGKFDNRYIDAMCITILQALESGQAVELLSDIAEQIKDMEVTVMKRKRGALDRSVTMYQLGILAAILGMVLYACVTQMFEAALTF